MIKKLLAVLGIVLAANAVMAKDTRYFEMRIYYCHPGKLEALIERFANHTTRIFEKHGMENIGYWVPADNKENALYYVLAYPDKAARDAAWKAFGDDPEWQKVRTASEKNGKIIEKITSIFMDAATISPVIQPLQTRSDRNFDLRTYYCHPGQLNKLISRFQNHTLAFFSKHGMTNIAYWTTIEPDNAQSRLVYLVAHATPEKGLESWDTFRKDPDWIKARDLSEKDGPIVEKVETIALKPLSFSKIK
ncbi:MAG: NIPSNAP family protein [Chitinophagaceae bacterium]|nr:NIPSNAP family protein [Chitinophagaceae bacterium]MCW5927605.1 NIPSNAP family protein [Chitinophagaceae bacterium]